MTLWNFYFQLHPGSIKSAQVIAFLSALARHAPGKLLVVWDGLRAHWSRAVREHAEANDILLEQLPAYAPELNPVEYLWGYWKRNCMANLCPENFAHLSTTAKLLLRRLRRRKTIITAFWQQADLF